MIFSRFESSAPAIAARALSFFAPGTLARGMDADFASLTFVMIS
jgi:hypothetical protein